MKKQIYKTWCPELGATEEDATVMTFDCDLNPRDLAIAWLGRYDAEGGDGFTAFAVGVYVRGPSGRVGRWLVSAGPSFAYTATEDR